MFKNKKLLGVLISIVMMLAFSIGGHASYYKYTQESGANFYVGTGDKSDAIEDTNELRQIIDDLGNLLVHSKRTDLYPKDETTGGSLQIPEAGLKFNNAPANNDIAAYIAGEMKWQTKAELGIDLSLYYLKTAIDSLSEVETIWSKNVTDSTELATALTDYYLKTAIDTQGEMETIWGTSLQPLDTALTNISALAYVSPSLIKLTANDTYAVRTLAEIKEDLSLNYVENLKVKLDGTQAPTVNNDTDEGYVVGSRWFDITNDKEYVCLDNTDGAAVWTETTGAAGGYTNLTSFVEQTAWRLFYSNADGDVVELALGADGTYLESNGAAAAPTFTTPSGAGDVVKVGTPADSQIGVWTGDGTIEGAASLTYDGSNLQLTGDIGSTGTPITKGWFTDMTVANAIAADITGNAATVTSFTPASGSLTLAGADALTLTTTAGTNVTLPTTGTLATLAGDEVLTNKDINFVNALGSDHTYSGELDSQPVGENVVFGQLLYYDWTDVEWKLAKADTFATAKATRIALESKSDGQTCLMLVKGYIRDDSAFDFGAARVFLNDDTFGACDDTAPAESGDQIFVVGEAKSADILFFDPGKDVGEI